jgi:hypothetical protein
MNSFNPNYFIHAANVLLLVAYSVRDIAVGASLISIDAENPLTEFAVASPGESPMQRSREGQFSGWIDLSEYRLCQRKLCRSR